MNAAIIREALMAYRTQWEMWLRLKHTTEAERELATLKIQIIDIALGEMV